MKTEMVMVMSSSEAIGSPIRQYFMKYQDRVTPCFPSVTDLKHDTNLTCHDERIHTCDGALQHVALCALCTCNCTRH